MEGPCSSSSLATLALAQRHHGKQCTPLVMRNVVLEGPCFTLKMPQLLPTAHAQGMPPARHILRIPLKSENQVLQIPKHLTRDHTVCGSAHEGACLDGRAG